MCRSAVSNASVQRIYAGLVYVVWVDGCVKKAVAALPASVSTKKLQGARNEGVRGRPWIMVIMMMTWAPTSYMMLRQRVVEGRRFSVSPLSGFAQCSAEVHGNGLGVRSKVGWKATAVGNLIKWDKRKMVLPGSSRVFVKRLKGRMLKVSLARAAQRRRNSVVSTKTGRGSYPRPCCACRAACQVCSGTCRVSVTSDLSVHLRRGLIKTRRWRLSGEEVSILERSGGGGLRSMGEESVRNWRDLRQARRREKKEKHLNIKVNWRIGW